MMKPTKSVAARSAAAVSEAPTGGPGRHAAVPDHTDRVVIVGGGTAGLAMAVALQRRGCGAIILERGDGVAESWRNRHAELRLNTVRWLSDLPGLRLPAHSGRWVHRDDFVHYLEKYRAHHDLDVRPRVTVDRIRPRASGGWAVDTSAGTVVAPDVVVATGHDRVPYIPEWPGADSCAIPVLHVADHRRAADLAGQRVLLVGAGNSGVEIAGHLVDAGVERLWVSVRTPPNLLPREVAGVPLHPLTVLLRPLPEPLRDRLAGRVARGIIGDLSPYGLPMPEDGPYRRMRERGVTVAVDQGFAAHVRARRAEVVADVAQLEAEEVVLTDGTRLRPDLVLAATGFRPGLADLVDVSVLDPAGRPLRGPVAQMARAPGLWFVGFHPAIEGNIRQHPREARRIARRIAARRTGQPR